MTTVLLLGTRNSHKMLPAAIVICTLGQLHKYGSVYIKEATTSFSN